ncbi:MAG: AbrB/MazE/SpoVT family DNA-binding domain-containing protein [Candidatus Nitrosocosmicus sp.]|nr:AbrB/MazE/SpoVT family DNA-binding domain-containing protein [Candidatus Nitrosocosmicus sp.]MDN5867324.1 AbrB/MazE/SpoVT family DNA-binding domain-containing protein [Candidatus Nitrosocosmicus sp.]
MSPNKILHYVIQDLMFFKDFLTIYIMNKGKVIGDSRILKRGIVTIPVKVREKLRVKEGDFLTYVETRNGHIRIIK